MKRVFLLLGCAVGACGGVRSHSHAAVGPLALRSVEWNPSHATMGQVRAVADDGDTVVVFASGAARVLVGGAVVATDHKVKDWSGAAVIPGTDGSARWVVGIDNDGHVRYLRARAIFEDISDRYALSNSRVSAIASLGAGRVGFSVDNEIAVADGANVTRFSFGPLSFLAGGGGRIAGAVNDSVVVFDVVGRTGRRYRLRDVNAIAFTRSGRLFVATRCAIYAEDSLDGLALVYRSDASALHGLAASGDRVWFGDGSDVGVVEGNIVAKTTGAGLDATGKLQGSSNGDLWIVTDQSLRRYTPLTSLSDPYGEWESRVRPVFMRVCASCHGPNASSGIDLSNVEVWNSKRKTISERVVAKRTMPPPGHTISEADLNQLEAWLGAKHEP